MHELFGLLVVAGILYLFYRQWKKTVGKKAVAPAPAPAPDSKSGSTEPPVVGAADRK